MIAFDRPVRVLVADDQAPFRRAVLGLLAALPGFALVGETTTGEEAVELTSSLEPDLVLMDIKMPGIGGIEATRRIVAARPATMIVLVSTYRADDLSPDAWTCGATEYVHKEDLSSGLLVRLWSTRLTCPDRRGRRAPP